MPSCGCGYEGKSKEDWQSSQRYLGRKSGELLAVLVDIRFGAVLISRAIPGHHQSSTVFEPTDVSLPGALVE